jgi:hypothetical protein
MQPLPCSISDPYTGVAASPASTTHPVTSALALATCDHTFTLLSSPKSRSSLLHLALLYSLLLTPLHPILAHDVPTSVCMLGKETSCAPPASRSSAVPSSADSLCCPNRPHHVYAPPAAKSWPSCVALYSPTPRPRSACRTKSARAAGITSRIAGW